MPYIPTVEFSCCGFSLRLGVVLITWFFLMLDVSILVVYLMEAMAVAPVWHSQRLDVAYLLRAHHSPLDAFESSRAYLWGDGTSRGGAHAHTDHTKQETEERKTIVDPQRFGNDTVAISGPRRPRDGAGAAGRRPAWKPRGVLVAQVPIGVFFIVVDIMLLLGVWSDSLVLLSTWMCATGARAALELVSAVVTLVRWVGSRSAPPSLALRLILRLVIVLCEGYCVIVTYSYYRLTAVLNSVYANHHAERSRRLV